MKITPSNINPLAGKIINKGIKPSSDQHKPAAGSVDTITISQQWSVEDEKFLESLKNQILRDVRSGVDAHRLDDLKRQIASGDYNVNPAEIVHKMIGEPSDVE